MKLVTLKRKINPTKIIKHTALNKIKGGNDDGDASIIIEDLTEG